MLSNFLQEHPILKARPILQNMYFQDTCTRQQIRQMLQTCFKLDAVIKIHADLITTGNMLPQSSGTLIDHIVEEAFPHELGYTNTEVWTASHCSSPERFEYLLDAVGSVQRLGLKHRIAVSGITPEQAALLPDDIILSESRQSQFCHFRQLYRSSQASSRTRIIFLDDDDLLLKMPPDQSRVQGCQVLFENDKIQLTPKMFELMDTSRIYSDRFVNDFSGYTLLKFDLGKFFLQESSTAPESLKDIELMKYVDKLMDRPNPKVYHDQVFIGHRLWGNISQHDWINQLLEQ